MIVRTPAVPTAQNERTLARALLVLSAIVVLGVALVAGSVVFLGHNSSTTAISVSATLLQTAGVIDTHGAAMADHGRRLEAAARSSSGPDRDHWIADGRQMAADGVSLVALAERIRAAARLLGRDPTSASTADLSALRGEAASLIGEGQAATVHGRGMMAHATVMATLAAKPDSGISVADAMLMAADAPLLVDAGEQVTGVGQSLKAFVDQMQRSIGR